MLVGGEMILKQTVDPEQGYAVKEMFFTQKNEALYVILPRWPDKSVLVKGVHTATNARVSFLGQKGNLKWKQKGTDLEIEIPEKCVYNFTPEDNYAYVIKISNFKIK